MVKISVAEAQAFDRQAQEKYGLPSIVLMENAGRSVAEEAIKLLGKKKQVLVVCGVGNNGGDGLVAARHLYNAGKDVEVVIVGDKSKLKTDPAINLKIIEKLPIETFNYQPEAKKFGSGSQFPDLIIDALFGLGLSSVIKEPFLSAIDLINQADKPVLSVDVPSGLEADSGRALGVGVKPTVTVTFVAVKNGLTEENSGRIIVRDIGIIK